MGTPAVARSTRLRSELMNRRQGFSPPQHSKRFGLGVTAETGLEEGGRVVVVGESVWT